MEILAALSLRHRIFALPEAVCYGLFSKYQGKKFKSKGSGSPF